MRDSYFNKEQKRKKIDYIVGHAPDKKDKILKCWDCGDEFVFKIGEQGFYQSMKFAPPKHCPKCRARRRHEKRKREKELSFNEER